MFITTKRVDCCIIFTADGWSFVEKGTMVVIGKMARKAVILAPRSGLVINDVKRSRFMKTVIVTSIRASDYVICQGKNWSNFYQSVSGEPEEKFKVIPNWIAVDKYAPADQDRRDGKVRILYLSWVEKNKGIFDLVTVAEQLVRVEPNVLFLVAGSGAAIQELRDSIADKGLEKNFELLGWVQGVGKQNLLCSSDIFVLPSYFEGYPNALVEAMASGLPVLATKVGSITEIVKHNRNGMLFNSGDTKMFESMLRQVVSDRDLRRRLGKNARATILRNNSLESAVENFTNIIEDAIGNPQC
jgi:glycosyltransferase involved in cell wall biosynthesis